MSKLTKKMLLVEVIVALSGGNPGAQVAATAIFKEANKQRAKNVPQDLHMLYRVDALGLQDSSLHSFYAVLCKSDAAAAIAVLLSVDLGIIKKQTLLDAVTACSQGRLPEMDVDAVRKKVNQKLMFLSVSTTGKA